MSVSVVIPTRNKAATLSRAIVSAASQNPVEVLVVDDASTDDTPGIVEQLRGVYSCIRYERHSSKAADWQEAMAHFYCTLQSSHVIHMGADDWLANGVVDSVNRHPDAAVVFHDYLVANTDGTQIGAVSNGFESVMHMSAAQMCSRLVEYPYPTETGIGSGMRLDCLRWLEAKHFWRMGPWSDAIGFAAVAALWGCVFVPSGGATFTQDDHGYGATNRNSSDSIRYMAECISFLASSGVPSDAAAALCRKRGVHA
jgi:hypothetical protein